MTSTLKEIEDIRLLDIGDMGLGGYCSDCNKRCTIKRTGVDTWTFKCECKFTFLSTKGHMITRPLDKDEYEEYKRWKESKK